MGVVGSVAYCGGEGSQDLNSAARDNSAPFDRRQFRWIFSIDLTLHWRRPW